LRERATSLPLSTASGERAGVRGPAALLIFPHPDPLPEGEGIVSVLSRREREM